MTMPPKRRPDQVIVHRIELQTKEREALEIVAVTSSIRNVGQGIGSVLAPFGDALAIIVGAIVAKEGAEYLWGKASDFFEKTTRSLEEMMMEAWEKSDTNETFEEFTESRKKPKIKWFSGWGYWRKLLGYE